MSALSWSILQGLIVRAQALDGVLKRALGSDCKGKVSPVLFVGAGTSDD